MPRRLAFVLSICVLLISVTQADAARLSGPLRRLEGHGLYWATSIKAANGGQPVRNPSELWLGFGSIADYEGKNFEHKSEYPALFWESNCNEHDYRLMATWRRLKLTEAGSTLVLCGGRAGREEAWLERFFEADPDWRLRRGQLILTDGGSRIVMHHRPPRPA
jgi:hypothetical protein